MSFIRDVTIGEGESVQPNTSFVKTWRIQNNGKYDYRIHSQILGFEIILQVKCHVIWWWVVVI